mgnify:CR=1 FL=1
MRTAEQNLRGRRTEIIWDQYHKDIQNFILDRVIDISDADDILQEVFTEVYRYPTLLEQRRGVHTWIYRLTRRVILAYYCDLNELDEAAAELIDSDIIFETETPRVTSMLLPVFQPESVRT